MLKKLMTEVVNERWTIAQALRSPCVTNMQHVVASGPSGLQLPAWVINVIHHANV